MSLELVQVPYRSGTPPFPLRDGYKFGWRSLMRDPDKATYFEVLRDRTAVARVETDENSYFDCYVGVPSNLRITALEIQLIDVLEQHRRQGIGRAVIEDLSRMYPDRRLVAFSEDADEFWRHLGWDRFERRVDDPRYPSASRPLYVQGGEGFS
ncbi:GNAT family N-acetyltransferase [Mycolicibacterium fluoranthenivorans]|uniref:GNAT family N-acetyltransferase n=1 Tax=Mycolicibacterium fluoranthenivorans TaxID=258505 RepID=A0A7G8P9I1_9MYCO|nr:GNAT family N-acetyltransferase [Mycolicibacterium fluoranthenivorans]QNJ90997.1 GNAT family N-acetyltransferase [Mycolicibacterium fluoranthenivorans]